MLDPPSINNGEKRIEAEEDVGFDRRRDPADQDWPPDISGRHQPRAIAGEGDQVGGEERTVLGDPDPAPEGDVGDGLPPRPGSGRWTSHGFCYSQH